MKVLVISAHPDDETLGCGGTLLRHGKQKDELCWLIVTRPIGDAWSAEVVERKGIEIEKVAKAYGMAKYFRLDFPAARLDTVPLTDLMNAVREVISDVRPEVVYLVHEEDVHTDHHAVFTATFSVVKSFYMRSFGIRKVLCYETLSSTEAAALKPNRLFIPNVFQEITPFLDRKIEIMGFYETEAQADPMPRGPSAIRALARHRGATIGVEYAEAFQLIREVN